MLEGRSCARAHKGKRRGGECVPQRRNRRADDGTARCGGRVVSGTRTSGESIGTFAYEGLRKPVTQEKALRASVLEYSVQLMFLRDLNAND